MNRTTRRTARLMRAKKNQLNAHVCQDGAHVLYSPGNGYLRSANQNHLEFVVGMTAEINAQRFHQGCAGAFAAQVGASFGVTLEVRHQDQAKAEGWK